MRKIEDEYLGDGVYVGFDGFAFVLDLRGQDDITRIVMEPDIINQLTKYVEQTYKLLKEGESN